MQAETISGVLGGRAVLGRFFRNAAQLGDAVRTGLPATSVVALAKTLRLSNGAMVDKLGIPQRTFTRRLSQGALLTPAESDRTARVARIYATAVDLLGNGDIAAEWLVSPNRALSGRKPLDELDTDMGARRVEDVLGRIAYGVYS